MTDTSTASAGSEVDRARCLSDRLATICTGFGGQLRIDAVWMPKCAVNAELTKCAFDAAAIQDDEPNLQRCVGLRARHRECGGYYAQGPCYCDQAFTVHVIRPFESGNRDIPVGQYTDEI